MELATIVTLASAPAHAGDAGGGVLGWDLLDLPLLLTLPVLLALSGFFSGSETALFGLSEAQRMSFRHAGSLGHRAVDALLVDQRMLLITILLGNMTVNVLFFVISSVLMMRSSAGGIAQSVMATVFLIVIVVVGEVGPKMLATAARTRCAVICAPPLLTLHRAIGPVRLALAHWVVGPLSRLTAPHAPPPELDDAELNALLEISGEQGVIDDHERRMLLDVVGMRRLRVRDVMTPRVRMAALPVDATRADVERIARERRLSKVPVYENDLDHVRGLLHVKRYLLDPEIDSVTSPKVMTEAHFVPDIARLEQLLDQFRRWREQSAIVVDEYGGTEGLVSVEDVVEELVGDILGHDEVAPAGPRLVGLGRWEVSGDANVHDFAEAFGIALPERRVNTLGGLIADELGRAPAPGDRVELDRVVVEVEAVKRSRVLTASVRLRDEGDGAAPPAREQRS